VVSCGEEVVEGAGGGSAEGIGGDGVEGCGGAVGIVVDYGFDGFEAGKRGVGCFFFLFSAGCGEQRGCGQQQQQGMQQARYVLRGAEVFHGGGRRVVA